MDGTSIKPDAGGPTDWVPFLLSGLQGLTSLIDGLVACVEDNDDPIGRVGTALMAWEFTTPSRLSDASLTGNACSDVRWPGSHNGGSWQTGRQGCAGGCSPMKWFLTS